MPIEFVRNMRWLKSGGKSDAKAIKTTRLPTNMLAHFMRMATGGAGFQSSPLPTFGPRSPQVTGSWLPMIQDCCSTAVAWPDPLVRRMEMKPLKLGLSGIAFLLLLPGFARG